MRVLTSVSFVFVLLKDVNKNGHIMYTEFLAATIEYHGYIEEERVAAAFDRLDSDDFGKFSRIIHLCILNSANITEPLISSPDRLYISREPQRNLGTRLHGEGDRRNHPGRRRGC